MRSTDGLPVCTIGFSTLKKDKAHTQRPIYQTEHRQIVIPAQDVLEFGRELTICADKGTVLDPNGLLKIFQNRAE
jgi:hypothetical protein